MNQSKAFLVSMVIALLGMVLVYLYVEKRSEEVKSEYGNAVTVVVASKDIQELQKIELSMLTTKTVPNTFKQPGAYDDPGAFEGAVASSPIRAGEQILATKVLMPGAATGISAQIAISRRAMSIPVNDVTGVTRLIKPGDRIDLITNIQYQIDADRMSETKTLMQNIHVLAVGELIQNKVPSAIEMDPVSGSQRAIDLRNSRAFATITVEVTPDQAQQLSWVLENSQQAGNLMITLRNPVDRVIASVSTTTVDEVLGQDSRKAEIERARRRPAAVAAPPPRPAPPPPAWGTGGSLAQ
jgi:pilus assembly protein CpaB